MFYNVEDGESKLDSDMLIWETGIKENDAIIVDKGRSQEG